MQIIMTWNQLRELPDNLLSGMSGPGTVFYLDCSNNFISTLGGIFGYDFSPQEGTVVKLDNNNINTSGLVAAMSSYMSAAGQLSLHLTNNSITELPGEWLRTPENVWSYLLFL